jgi:hypothetical protein
MSVLWRMLRNRWLSVLGKALGEYHVAYEVFFVQMTAVPLLIFSISGSNWESLMGTSGVARVSFPAWIMMPVVGLHAVGRSAAGFTYPLVRLQNKDTDWRSPHITKGDTRILKYIRAAGEKLFFFLYVQNPIRFLVICLDYNSIRYAVEDPQFCVGHCKPSNEAVKRQEKCFSDTFNR